MSDKTSGSGIGIGAVLTIVFIVLKLVGVISWSWWWVLAPTWIPLCFSLIIIGFVFLIAIIGAGKK